MSFFGATGTPVLGFLMTSPLGFKTSGSAFFVEANVMYIPQDPPLVQHMLTSWHGQSPRQKTYQCASDPVFFLRDNLAVTVNP